MNMHEAAVQAASVATKALPLSLSLWQFRFSILSTSSQVSVALVELAAVAGQSSHLTKLLVQQMRANECKRFGNQCSEETAATLQSCALHFASSAKDESFMECCGIIFDAAIWSVASSSIKPVDSVFGCVLNST
jgi:hypothetical protein